jgi:hypothetical protein
VTGLSAWLGFGDRRALDRGLGRWLAGLSLLVGGLFALYLSTLAPSVTWANKGADSGDLISAAAVLGVAHPSGYPTYLLLARSFQLLPFGSLAYRTNLLSALSAALAAGFVAVLTRQCVRPAQAGAIPGSLAAGLAFGLSPLLWSQAVIAEVYALHVLLVAVVLCSVNWGSGAWRDWRTGGLLGLALGNHLTAVFLLPVCLGLIGWRARRVQAWALARFCAGLTLGLLVYLYVPLRARTMPAVNWGNASTWDGFWWLISGAPYRGLVFGGPLSDVLGRVPAWAGLALSQFGWLGILVSFYGLFFGRPRSAAVWWATGWLVVAFSLFAVIYATPDSFEYLLPAFLGFAVWIGLGITAALESVRRRPRWGVGLVGLFLLAVLVNAGLHWREVNAGQDARADTFGQTVMRTAPQGALVFAHGDQDVFTLWYFHFALGERRDVRVIVEPMLGFKWYRDTLRAAYPDLALPDEPSGPWPASLASANRRPACETRPEEAAALVCGNGGLP